MKPNLFLIGAAKCGTTSLAAWLGKHPDIYLIYGKESNFWRRDYYRGWEWYNKKHMKNYAGERYILDASTINLLLPYSAERIAEIETETKIIACVREPYARAYSHWAMLKSWRTGRVPGSFSDALIQNYHESPLDTSPFPTEAEYVQTLEPKGESYRLTLIEQGLYANNLQPYLDRFHHDDILIAPTSRLGDYYKTILCYLGLDQIDIDTDQHFNVGSGGLSLEEMVFDSMQSQQLFPLFKKQAIALEKFTNYNFIKDWKYDEINI